MSRSLRSARQPAKRLALLTSFIVLVLAIMWHVLFTPAYGDQLGDRTLQLANDEVSTSTTYQLSFDISTAGTLGSIKIQFCSNDPLLTSPCTVPGGFDDSQAVLADQAGPAGFSISSASTANQIILSRTPASTPAAAARYEFTGITNPSTPGPYYVRLQTFATDDASGPASDYGGIAFEISNSLAISAEVPPYLLLCSAITIPDLNCANSSGDYINFGELSSSHTSSGSSQLLVATNAQSGYNVTVNGTTMTSGNNVITALANGDVSRPGTGQFGLNLRANVTPPDGSDPTGPGSGQPQPNYGQPNFYRFGSGDTIINYTAPDNARLYTASYIVNVPPDQAPGIYVSTITYVCLANF